jgi:hypothetical protein
MNLSVVSQKRFAFPLRQPKRSRKTGAGKSAADPLAASYPASPAVFRAPAAVPAKTLPPGYVPAAVRREGVEAARPLSQRRSMTITIDAESVTQLRYLMMGNCHGLVTTMRIEPVRRNNRMKVTLALSGDCAGLVIDTVMRGLVRAEFGRILFE